MSINRALRTKSEKKLYTIEVVEAGEFEGCIYFYKNPCLIEMLDNVFGKEKREEIVKRTDELWNQIKKFIEENGLEIGRGKSVGLGKVLVKLEEGNCPR